jgi:dihydroneopterin aldolase
MITVFIENQHVKAQVGWFEEERKTRVDLWISIYARLRPVKVHEDLDRTLDYTNLVSIVITESSRNRKLLETLGEDIITAVQLAQPALVEEVEVIIRKRKLPVHGFNADCAGVKVFRRFSP